MLRRLWKLAMRALVQAQCPDCLGKGFKIRGRGQHAYCFNVCFLCRGTGRV